MKSFDRIIVLFIVLCAAAFLLVNISYDDERNGGLNVEISRAAREVENRGAINTDDYDLITGIYEYDGSEDFFTVSDPYEVREINNKIYRIDYKKDDSAKTKNIIIRNTVLGVFAAAVFAVLFYVRMNIIKPFEQIKNLPAELAKGNLAVPVKENKNRYFGKFLWGLDMLRENLEESSRKDLEHKKNEKTMLLSLSHDIKTPLSAIKLYSKALSKGIYTDPEKQIETAESISAKADEIEDYVNKIISASSDDFMVFEVEENEFYLSEVIKGIERYYADKLSVTGTEFSVEKYTDCMLSGDADRLSEVLQNILENAVKYGDGKQISIGFSDEENCRLITVRNSGCTLSDDELLHIFDSFWRGSNTSGKQGSGLGLYICRRLMTAMKGEIFAAAENGSMCVTAVCRKVG